jgi:hypothetical protein
MKKFQIISILLILTCCTTPDNRNSGITIFNDIPLPEATIVNFDIDSLSLRDITLLFDVEIKNPYPVKLKLSQMKSVFFIDKKQLFETSTDKLKIKAMGSATSRIPVTLKYSDIIDIVKNYGDREFLECEVDITLSLPLPESMHKYKKEIIFNFKPKQNIPAIKPEINIADFTVIKPSKKEVEEAIERSKKKNLNADTITNMFGAIIDGKNPVKVIDPSDLDLKLKVNFDVIMKNRTKATLVFQDLNYNFNINESKLVDGYTKDIKNKPGIYTLSVANEFSSKSLGHSVLSAFNKGTGNYTLKGFSMVKFPDKIRKTPIRLNFDEQGVLEIK